MTRARWLRLVLALALIGPAATASEPVTLRVTLQIAASNEMLGRSMVQFKEEVERETREALRVEIFDRGKLYIDDQVVGAVQSGAIEMGLAGISKISRRLPAADIMEQPFLFNFEALTRAATSPESELREVIDKAVLETLGVRVLWWQTAGPQVFITKGLELTDPASLKDKRVRAFSETTASFARLCGGRPQVLSVTKIHDGLKHGTLDAVMTAAVAVETRELWKVADTITRTDHAGIEFLFIINAKTWDGLSEVHKSVLFEAARRAERDIRDKAAKLEEKAYDFARSKGMKVVDLTPDQVAEWRACSSEVLDNYMRGGGELVRQMLAAYGKLRMHPCCNAGPAGTFHRR
jgi:C4-dicarboxylate-binding protein DctP